MDAAEAFVLVAVLGLSVGSFLNVCIHRLPRGESILTPPSRCPECGRLIRWYENVPVVSYLALGGRCRGCRGRISPMYPLVEIATAVIFVLHFWRFGWQPLLAPRLTFAAALITLFVTDLRQMILPNAITIPGIVAGFLFALVLPPGWHDSLAGIVIGGLVPTAILYFYLWIRRVEGMGGGDIKLLAMVGAFLGSKLVLLTIVLSSFLGSIVGLLLMVTRRGTLESKLPFGTFIAIAAIAVSLWGEAIVGWYLSFYP
jgi:leader peptidase (prepilin peptidase)/N-methyltransferase